MWLNERHQIPSHLGEGRTGMVTMAGEDLAVQLENEVRRPELYGPAGYRWIPEVGQRVLVIKSEGERPCVIGTDRDQVPAHVTIGAGTINLEGTVLIDGIPLDRYICELTGGGT